MKRAEQPVNLQAMFVKKDVYVRCWKKQKTQQQRLLPKVIKQQHQTQLEDVLSSLQTSAVTANRQSLQFSFPVLS